MLLPSQVGIRGHSCHLCSTYHSALVVFLGWVQGFGDFCRTAADIDYWFAMWDSCSDRDGSPNKSTVQECLFAIEFWLPEVKFKLPLTHRSVTGWDKLSPRTPHCPFTFDLALAVSLTAALASDVPSAVAMLLSFNC